MKHITKGGEPPELHKWRMDQKTSPQNLVYDAIPGATLDKVRDALLKEQGHICAYSMMRIASRSGGHVEHLLAQSKTRGTELSVRYDNMVYCYPGHEAPRCEFGAHKKDGMEFAPGEMISPLDPSCEARFAFKRDGSVEAANPSDEAANKTLSNLNLDCRALRRARKEAIDSLPIFSSTQERLSAKRAETLARQLLQRDIDGRFRAFAVALAQVAQKYAKRQAAKEAAMASR